MNTTTKNNPTETGHEPQLITRKEAIGKAGMIALSAATMMFLLNSPKKAYSFSVNGDSFSNQTNENPQLLDESGDGWGSGN